MKREGSTLEKYRNTLMERIEKAIRDAGYVPYDQLTAFLKTGDDRYITRRDNARDLIQEVDQKELQTYLNHLKHTR